MVKRMISIVISRLNLQFNYYIECKEGGKATTINPKSTLHLNEPDVVALFSQKLITK